MLKKQKTHNGQTSPAIQWLIVPRHPQRFDEVARAITQAGFTLSRRSSWADAPHSAPGLAGRFVGRDGAVLRFG